MLVGSLGLVGAVGVVFLLAIPKDSDIPFLHRFDTWKSRIVNFTEKEEVPAAKFDIDKDAQIAHARIAIATSNVVGKAPGNSVQRDFLSQAFSDFIFAIIGEELGLVGAAVVIALFLLLALLVGTSAYRAANDVRSSSDNTRLGLSLIANSIRATDGTDAVGVADGPEGLALVLTEHLGNGDYETRLYAYQGAIVEEYTRAGTAFTPEKAREIVRSSTFDFTYTDGLLTVHTDQGSTSVALRSVRGGA